MNTHTRKTQVPKNKTIGNQKNQSQPSQASTFQLLDTSPEGIAERRLQTMVNSSPQVQQAAQLQVIANNQMESIGSGENKTGMPDQLKSGIEHLSGIDISDVKVHYNSQKPAQLQAHAYAQGTAIHIAPGQEKHLPHEAWHVVQQKQGRVKPTMQIKGNINVNDDFSLEREADVMGAKTLQQALTKGGSKCEKLSNSPNYSNPNVVQAKFIGEDGKVLAPGVLPDTISFSEEYWDFPERKAKVDEMAEDEELKYSIEDGLDVLKEEDWANFKEEEDWANFDEFPDQNVELDQEAGNESEYLEDQNTGSGGEMSNQPLGMLGRLKRWGNSSSSSKYNNLDKQGIDRSKEHRLTGRQLKEGASKVSAKRRNEAGDALFGMAKNGVLMGVDVGTGGASAPVTTALGAADASKTIYDKSKTAKGGKEFGKQGIAAAASQASPWLGFARDAGNLIKAILEPKSLREQKKMERARWILEEGPVQIEKALEHAEEMNKAGNKEAEDRDRKAVERINAAMDEIKTWMERKGQKGKYVPLVDE